MATYFLLGRSHLTALWFAWHNQTESGAAPVPPYPHAALAPPGTRMVFLQLEATQYEPLNTNGDFHPAVQAAMAEATADIHVSVLGGNDHSMIGVAAHAPRFDFVLPEAPELPLDETAQLVPAGLLRAELARRIAPHVESLEILRRRVAGRIIHLESPPPLPEAHIRAHPAPFAAEIAELGIAPALLRYKLWRLHSALYQEACTRLGIAYLPSPPELRDAAGMMLPHACHPDATHGNARYGSHVLARLLAHAA